MHAEEILQQRPGLARERQEAGIAALLDLARGTAATVQLSAVGIEPASAVGIEPASRAAGRSLAITMFGVPAGTGGGLGHARPPGPSPEGLSGYRPPGEPGHDRANLLELVVRSPRLRVVEVPFTFAERHHGHSKASWREAARYLRQLAALRMVAAGRAGRLLRFAMVGGSGVMVNLLVLGLLLWAHAGAAWAGGQIIAAIAATQVAIGWNFALTERWVFPGRTGHWARRLVPFWALNCGALLAQLPLAARLQPGLGGSYLLATGTALAILILARFAVCDRWLYRPAGRRRVTVRP